MEFICLTKEQLEHHLPLFCELYRSCFSDYIDENIVRQRYLDHPSDELLMCVAMDQGRIVANYSAVPMVVNLHGTHVKAAISINTMTSPEYAGRGLFSVLTEQLYNKMQANGYALVYGFPNYLSNKTFVSKLGWKDIYEVPTMEYKIKLSVPSHVTDDSFFPCDIHNICQTADPTKIHIVKDAAYMKWRYEDIPDRNYYASKNSKGDWFLFKYYDTQINVVEFSLTSQASVAQMCNYLSTLAAKEGKTEITLWSQTNTDQHYWLEKQGFVNKAPIRYFAAKQLQDLDCDIFDYRAWNISMGDDNVY